MDDNLYVAGTLSAKLLDENGNTKLEIAGNNLIVNTGLNLIAAILGGTSTAYITYMAVGTSSTPVSVTDTALYAEIGRATTTTTISTNMITYVSTFAPGIGTGDIYECGLFNASSGGTMLSRSLDLVVPKGASDTLEITWTITISGS